MEERSAFQILKPACVKLSQYALSLSSGQAGAVEVANAQADLRNILTSIASSRPAALTHQLADYVFFPLSHVLRQFSKLPSRVLEDSLSCTLILLKTSWAVQMDSRLGLQLLKLLTIIVDSKSATGAVGGASTEELELVIQQCLAEVFRNLGRTRDGREALLQSSTLPHLGKAVFEILTKLKEGSSSAIQLAALDAVRAFIAAVDDDVALGTSFFPGLVSSIQKVLLPTSAKPRTIKLLMGALDTLSTLIIRVLADTKTRDLPKADPSSEEPGRTLGRLDQSWLAATTGQVKTILATVVKLRSHGRAEVRAALQKLCLSLIGQCCKTLSQAVPFLLETAVALMDGDGSHSALIELRTLLALDDTLADMLRNSLHNWLVSLPRVMQSKDETARSHLILQISTSFQMLSDADLDVSLVDHLLADQLRDSVASSISISAAGQAQNAAVLDAVSADLAVVPKSTNVEFSSVFAQNRASATAANELAGLVRAVAGSPSGVATAQHLIFSVEVLAGSQQIASFWAALEYLRMTFTHTDDTADFLAFSSSSGDQADDMMEQLYATALDLVDPSVFEEERDWRLQALAMEAIALYAQRHKNNFREELVEALYPMVHLLGADSTPLRLHAITCLNIVASATGYSDAKELIISNVDYLVNAVALRLNTFDISAQAPKVLLMMVKLTGPRLLPYLDDLVDSMFAALDAYHGYPKLVETIFAVLLGIAQEGAKSDQLLLTATTNTINPERALERTSVSQIAGSLRRLRDKREQDLQEIIPQGHPEQPWPDTASHGGDRTNISATGSWQSDAKAKPTSRSGDHEVEASKAPLPKTYTILLKISELTQHYLTASSPALRTSLLALLHATFPALSKHEDSFLPLINTLWPSVVSRLDDEEAYVVANAMETIAIICQYAGDFMKGRITALWDELKKLAKTRAKLSLTKRPVSNQSAADTGGQVGTIVGRDDAQARINAAAVKRGSAYVDAPTRLLQDAVVGVFQSIIEYVGVDEDIFDDMVGLTEAIWLDRPELRKIMERFNGDTIWLRSERLQLRASAGLMAMGAVPNSEPGYPFALVS